MDGYEIAVSFWHLLARVAALVPLKVLELPCPALRLLPPVPLGSPFMVSIPLLWELPSNSVLCHRSQ
jgi:hypothetical protein